MPVYLCSNGD